MIEIDTIIQGDCLEVMREIEGNSIDLTVTSPPYDKLRDYNGYNFHFEGIAKELYRITKQGGVVVWVVGDQTISGSETGTSFRQALYFKEMGFNLYDTMIYRKLDAQPNANRRYNQCFEFMFILSKGNINSFNPIRKRCLYANTKNNISTQRNVDGSFTQSRSDVRDTKIIDNIWDYNVGFNKTTKDIEAYNHPAIFPEALARDHILSWSNEGDLVLDPMCGSGTTCKMALLYDRRFIGIDISEEYCQIARRRVEDATLLKYSQPELAFM